jgi:hypothetical protein
MARIILEAEASMTRCLPRRAAIRENQTYSVAETICESIARAAEELPWEQLQFYRAEHRSHAFKHRPKACICAFSRNVESV